MNQCLNMLSKLNIRSQQAICICLPSLEEIPEIGSPSDCSECTPSNITNHDHRMFKLANCLEIQKQIRAKTRTGPKKGHGFCHPASGWTFFVTSRGIGSDSRHWHKLKAIFCDCKRCISNKHMTYSLITSMIWQKKSLVESWKSLSLWCIF